MWRGVDFYRMRCRGIAGLVSAMHDVLHAKIGNPFDLGMPCLAFPASIVIDIHYKRRTTALYGEGSTSVECAVEGFAV